MLKYSKLSSEYMLKRIIYCEVDMSISQEVKKTKIIINVLFDTFQTAVSPLKVSLVEVSQCPSCFLPI